jgi:hypothetical protein
VAYDVILIIQLSFLLHGEHGELSSGAEATLGSGVDPTFFAELSRKINHGVGPDRDSPLYERLESAEKHNGIQTPNRQVGACPLHLNQSFEYLLTHNDSSTIVLVGFLF